MAVDLSSQRSRRAVVTGAIGAGAAACATAIVRPSQADASSATFLWSDPSSPAVTATNTGSGSPAYAVSATSVNGTAIFAHAPSGTAIFALTPVGTAIVAQAPGSVAIDV